jgi:integral membrane protein (TIGR01906 family)
MTEKNNRTSVIIMILTATLVPIFLIIFAVRMMTTPLFARVEYNMPNFPADPYGFTKAERLEYSKYAIRYLTNAAGIEYLGDLTFEDSTPLFNERELSHMLDVKNLFSVFFNVWYGITLLLGALLIWCRQSGRWHLFRSALGIGGLVTIGIFLAFGLLVAIDFDWLFTQFHYVFFESDTWLFYDSDTLIRLFPLPFWRDAMIGILAITLLGAGLLIWQGRRTRNTSD